MVREGGNHNLKVSREIFRELDAPFKIATLCVARFTGIPFTWIPEQVEWEDGEPQLVRL